MYENLGNDMYFQQYNNKKNSNNKALVPNGFPLTGRLSLK